MVNGKILIPSVLTICLSACGSPDGATETAPGSGEPTVDDSQAPDDDGALVGPETTDRESAKSSPPVARVDLSATHYVEFFEPEPGVLLVSETGSIGADPDSHVKSFDSAAALYSRLAGGDADVRTLANLRAADDRVKRLRTRITTAPVRELPDNFTQATGLLEKHSSFLNGNQCSHDSFEGNYCPDARLDRIIWSDSGWDICTERFRSTVFNHSYTSTTGSALHKIYYWGTKGDFWAWVAEAKVTRGTWQSWFSSWRFVKAVTDRTWGQVSPGDHDHCVLKDFLLDTWVGCNVDVVACSI